MLAQASCTPVLYQGLKAYRVSLPGGDRLELAEHGAHVLSWRTHDRERLYMSPRSVFDGQAALRGGVPVCWPQFNQRGPLPKHGFARNLPWHLTGFVPQGNGALLTMGLLSSDQTQAWWPSAFNATLGISLQPGVLGLTLTVHNTGEAAWAFTGALHSYLAVGNVETAQLDGLGGQAEWDAVRDVHGQAAGALSFNGEFDRVYTAAPQALHLREPGHTLSITQSPSWAHTVVWNPGAERASTLADLPPGGWRAYVCVEAAQVFEPVWVQPGDTWTGWQRLAVV